MTKTLAKLNLLQCVRTKKRSRPAGQLSSDKRLLQRHDSFQAIGLTVWMSQVSQASEAGCYTGGLEKSKTKPVFLLASF